MRSVVNWSTVIFHQRNTMKSVTLDDTKEYFREKKELLDNKKQMNGIQKGVEFVILPTRIGEHNVYHSVGDLPKWSLKRMLDSSVSELAIDTETRGLNPLRDRLCLVQISAGDSVYIVSFPADKPINAPNLTKLFTDFERRLIFHYARFDIGFLSHNLGINFSPWNRIRCTKIASKLARTTTSSHSLKECLKEQLGVELDKTHQTSDWSNFSLENESQVKYAIGDVIHLVPLLEKLEKMLVTENRLTLFKEASCMVPVVAALDLAQFPAESIIGHS